MMVLALILGLAVATTVWFILFKPVFRDKHGFGECLGYVLQPDVWSWIQGDLGHDWWCTIKFHFWLWSGGFAGCVTYGVLVAVLG